MSQARVEAKSDINANSLINKIKRSKYYNNTSKLIDFLIDRSYAELKGFLSPRIFGKQPFEILASKKAMYYQGRVIGGFTFRDRQFIIDVYPINNNSILVQPKDQKNLDSLQLVYPRIFADLGIQFVIQANASSYPEVSLESMPGYEGFNVIFQHLSSEKIRFSKIFRIQLDKEDRPLIFYAAPNKKGYVIVASFDDQNMIFRHAEYCRKVLGIKHICVIEELACEIDKKKEISSPSTRSIISPTVKQEFNSPTHLRFRNKTGESSAVSFFPCKTRPGCVGVPSKRDEKLLDEFLTLYPEHAAKDEALKLCLQRRKEIPAKLDPTIASGNELILVVADLTPNSRSSLVRQG